jgi:uncharacterized phage protein gp47/JayE
MPFARPSLTGLRNLAVQDITTSGVPGLTGLLRNAVLRVLAWCMAGLAYSVYGYADWIARMGVPFTAADEFLFAWAALIGVYPKPATAASGSAQFTGTIQTPALVLPAGTALTRQDGTPYVTTADGTVDPTGNLIVPMTATATGAYTNCDPGTPISIAQPVTGINSGGVTVGGTTGGADDETNDALRTRMLARYAAPPQGGASTDYIEWALEVSGCTRAWCLGNGMGPGTVIVYVMFDGNDTNGFPQGTDGVSQYETRPVSEVSSGDQGLVADHIYPLQPVTALVYVCAPAPYPIDVTLIGLEPNTVEMQQAISAALTDMLLVVGEPGGIVYPSQLYDAILSTPGIVEFTMTVPTLPVQMPPGALPTLGTLSFGGSSRGRPPLPRGQAS